MAASHSIIIMSIHTSNGWFPGEFSGARKYFETFCTHKSLDCQYSETNVMHFLFSLLRIKGLYMFRALLGHPQEALHNGTCYIPCVLCQLAAPIRVQPTDITRTQYTKCRLYCASWGWVRNARNMYRPLILNKLNKSASRWFHYTDIVWCRSTEH
jgi:hypothetical protein